MEIPSNPYAAPLTAPPASSPDLAADRSDANRTHPVRLTLLLIDSILMVPYFLLLCLVCGFLFRIAGQDYAALIAGVPPYLFGLIMIGLYYLPFRLVLKRTPAAFLSGSRPVRRLLRD